MKLNDIDCILVCDLKLINAILGISSHSRKHAILSLLPLRELHLLMGLVNWVLELLWKVLPKEELQESMSTKRISIRGYHGGGLDGGNSNLFLNHLNFLSTGTPHKAKPIFDMLVNFKAVVKGCFSLDLEFTFKADIDQFNKSVVYLIKHSNKKLQIPLGPT